MKWIEVRTIAGNELVSVIDLPANSNEHYIERVMRGLLVNMNPEMYAADHEGDDKPDDPRKTKA